MRASSTPSAERAASSSFATTRIATCGRITRPRCDERASGHWQTVRNAPVVAETIHEHGATVGSSTPPDHDHGTMAHDRHAGHSVAMFRDKFWLTLGLTIPVVLLSTDIQTWFGYTTPSFPGSVYVPATLGTVVFLYGALVFPRGARTELADRQPGMMTLISL